MGMKDNLIEQVLAIADGLCQRTQSYVHHGSDIYNGTAGPEAMTNIFSNSRIFEEFLRYYHFTSSTIEIFRSTINEVLDTNNWNIVVNGDENSSYTAYARALVKNSHFKEFIKNNLADYIYYGRGTSLIYENRPLNNRTESLDIIYKSGKYIATKIDDKFISREHAVSYFYDTGKINNIKTGKKITIEGMKFDDDPYESFTGKSIYTDVLPKIFQMYVLEVCIFYLGLKDSIRPTLLNMSTGGTRVDNDAAIELANETERLLNEPVAMIGSVVEPNAFMQNLMYSLLNGVRVVPSIEQYSNLTENQADNVNRRDRLLQEYENLKKQVLAELTIPEEVFNGMANKWEFASRNDRFLTTINNMIAATKRQIIQFISNCTGIVETEIDCNLDISIFLSNYSAKNKMNAASDQINNLNQFISSYKQLIAEDNLNYIDRVLATKWCISKVDSFDPSITNLLKDQTEESLTELNEVTGNDGSAFCDEAIANEAMGYNDTSLDSLNDMLDQKF